MQVTVIEWSIGQNKAHFQRFRLFTGKLKKNSTESNEGSQENDRRVCLHKGLLIKCPWNEFMGLTSQFHGKENETAMENVPGKSVVATAHTSSQEPVTRCSEIFRADCEACVHLMFHYMSFQ